MNQLDVALFNLSPEQIHAFLPYLWLCGGLALSTIGVGLRLSNNVVRALHALALIPFIALLACSYNDGSQSIFGTSLEINAFTRAVGMAAACFGLLAGFFARETVHGHSEWSPLTLTAVIGMSLLPGARDWIAFFVFLETLAIPGYLLVALDIHRESSLEAAIKYLLMGAFASSLLLMGMTLLYGEAGSFDFGLIKKIFESGPSAFAVAGALLIAASLAFKVALAPFHLWAPDVYQAAPSSSASFLATATKVSVFGAAAVAFSLSGFWSLKSFVLVVQTLAIVSIVWGNLAAVAQRKLRRMLAYSSVANAGYAALALAVGPVATPAMLLTLIVYGFAVIAAFSAVDSFCRSSGQPEKYDVDLSELGVLASRAPKAAVIVFSLSLFSLAGIPPFPGFLGKYLVLSEVWTSGFTCGAAFMLLGTMLGLAYYLKALVPLYLEKTEPTSWTKRRVFSGAVFSGTVATLALILCLTGFSRFHHWVQLVEVFAR